MLDATASRAGAPKWACLPRVIGCCVSTLAAPGLHRINLGRSRNRQGIRGALPAAREAGTRWTRTMSNSFAEFLARLHSQDDAAAQELFVRFARQLIALARRHIDAGLRHKVDPED